jgi:hypothetical protein
MLFTSFVDGNAVFLLDVGCNSRKAFFDFVVGDVMVKFELLSSLDLLLGVI